MHKRRNHLQKNIQKTLKEYGNIIQYIQMQIWGDLGFSGCVVFLHVITVIFQKEVVTESKSLWKSNFQVWALRTVYYTS